MINSKRFILFGLCILILAFILLFFNYKTFEGNIPNKESSKKKTVNVIKSSLNKIKSLQSKQRRSQSAQSKTNDIINSEIKKINGEINRIDPAVDIDSEISLADTDTSLMGNSFSPTDTDVSTIDNSFSPADTDTSLMGNSFSLTDTDVSTIGNSFSPGFPPSFSPGFSPPFNPSFSQAAPTDSRPTIPDDYSYLDASSKVSPTSHPIPSAGIYKWTFTVPSENLTATGVMIVDSNNDAKKWFIMSTSPDDKTRVLEIDNVLDKCKGKFLGGGSSVTGTKASDFEFIGFGRRGGHSYKYTANSIANLGKLSGDSLVGFTELDTFLNWLIDKDNCIRNKKQVINNNRFRENNNRFSWNGPDDFVMGLPLSHSSESGLAIYINGLGKHISDYYGGSMTYGQVYFRTRINTETRQSTLVMEQFIDGAVNKCSLYWGGYKPVVDGGWYEVDPSTYTLTFDKITQDDLNELIADTAYIETYSPADAALPMGLQLQR